MAHRSPHDENDPRTGDPLADLEACLAGLVNAVDKGVVRELAPHGLIPVEFGLLRYCHAQKQSTATELAEVLPVDGSRVSRIVTGLVERGLLRRRRLRSDRRVVMLSLSDEGRELLARVVEAMIRYDAMLAEGVTDEAMRVFISVSRRIIDNHADMHGPA